MDLAFQYFLVAGAGVGMGLSVTIFPAWLIANKINKGGFTFGKKRG